MSGHVGEFSGRLCDSFLKSFKDNFGMGCFPDRGLHLKGSTWLLFSPAPPSVSYISGGQNRGNSYGKHFAGVQGYLEGIFGNPSLTQVQ